MAGRQAGRQVGRWEGGKMGRWPDRRAGGQAGRYVAESDLVKHIRVHMLLRPLLLLLRWHLRCSVFLQECKHSMFSPGHCQKNQRQSASLSLSFLSKTWTRMTKMQLSPSVCHWRPCSSAPESLKRSFCNAVSNTQRKGKRPRT